VTGADLADASISMRATGGSGPSGGDLKENMLVDVTGPPPGNGSSLSSASMGGGAASGGSSPGVIATSCRRERRVTRSSALRRAVTASHRPMRAGSLMPIRSSSVA
jgi:hypothetical protein